MCSTPYGIKGYGTFQTRSRGQIVLCVLNALRHQRLRHMLRSRQVWIELCSAQRLTASKVTAQLLLGSLFPIREVLNALRHQRLRHVNAIRFNSKEVKCSTPYGIKGYGTLKATYNLLPIACAQRLTASKVTAQFFIISFAKLRECSTPYGIKGYGTATAESLKSQLL